MISVFSTLSKLPFLWCLAAGLQIAAAVLGQGLISRFEIAIETRVATATDLEKAKWQSALDAANLEIARQAVLQAEEAMRLNQAIRQAEDKARLAQEDLETANAALPDGDRCGLDHARIRLLDKN